MLKEDDQKLINALSFAKAGTNRIKVIKTIAKDTKMPSQIYNTLELRPSQISATLRELKDNKLVICLNEERKRGRLYQLTDMGLQVYEILDDNVEE